MAEIAFSYLRKRKHTHTQVEVKQKQTVGQPVTNPRFP